MDKIHRFEPVGITPLPLSNLHNALIFLCSFYHQVTLFNHLKAVPVVGCPDYNQIDIFVIDQFTPVLIKICWLLSTYFLNIGGSEVKNTFINIAQSNTFYLGMLKKFTQVTESHAVAPYKTNI